MNKIRKEYVAGFLFSPDEKEVLLIQKNRPDWQRGKLNGIGGHVEPVESRVEAMKREFLNSWQECVSLHGDGWLVHFYYSFGDLSAAKTMTDEKVQAYSVSKLPDNIIPNLKYLIPIRLDKTLLIPISLWEKEIKREPV